MTFIKFLQGKKTYIVGFLSIVLGIINSDTQLIMTGIGLITLRAGVNNAVVQGLKGIR